MKKTFRKRGSLMKSTSARCALLDELRGLDLISMMLYHGMWDLVYLFGVSAPWYGSWQGELWQQSICWVFLLLSGFCLPLGRHPVKRGAMVFGCGALVTAVTLIFMPADVVWFGVLTLLGSAMIITGLLDGSAGKVAGKGAAGGRPCRELFSVLLHPPCSRWLFAAGPLAHHTAGFSLRQLLHGLSGVLSLWLLLYGLLPTDPVALPVLGWFLSASSGKPNSAESPSAASFGLPAAGVAGAELVDAISASPAGDLRRADGGVPVAAPGWRSALKNSAKGS